MMKSSSKKLLFLPFPSLLRSLLQHYLCFKHRRFFKGMNRSMDLREGSEGAIFSLFEVLSMLKVSVIKLSGHKVGVEM